MTSWSMTEPTPIYDSYAAYGCDVNTISIEELFQRYEISGFIYPEKQKMLRPYMNEIVQNWKKARRAGELILWTSTYNGENGNSGCWATLSSWRSCRNGWVAQHLVSTGNPVASRAVMLSGQAVRIRDSQDRSQQIWFQPTKRMPMKVFGSLAQSLGSKHSVVQSFAYVRLPLNKLGHRPDGVSVKLGKYAEREAIKKLAVSIRGEQYFVAEELDGVDLELEEVDQLYGRVGLRRYRRIWLAIQPGNEEPIAMLIAYRGPLGFNFSFLENRCDLLVEPGLTEEIAYQAINGLLWSAAACYEDFAPNSLYVTCDEQSRRIIEAIGGTTLRHYAQSIWMSEGFVGMYRHMEKFYSRIINAAARRNRQFEDSTARQ